VGRAAALSAALLAAIGAPGHAEACVLVDGMLVDQFPRNGTVTRTNDGFAVHFMGIIEAEPTLTITTSDGEPVERTFEVEQYQENIFSSVFFFRPLTPLSTGRHSLNVRYQTFRMGEVTAPPSRFEVLPMIERQSIPVRASWDRVTFDELTGTSCGQYVQRLYLTLEAEHAGEEPLWLLVEIEGRARPETGYSATESTRIVPTRTTGGSDPAVLVADVGFDADCITVTPLRLSGPAGEPIRSCQPERCLSLAAAETDPFEEIDLEGAGPCEGTGGLELAPEGGCGCQAAETRSPNAWMAPLLLLFLLRRLTS
jgi:MYXO-CTERM domain-containing protein